MKSLPPFLVALMAASVSALAGTTAFIYDRPATPFGPAKSFYYTEADGTWTANVITVGTGTAVEIRFEPSDGSGLWYGQFRNKDYTQLLPGTYKDVTDVWGQGYPQYAGMRIADGGGVITGGDPNSFVVDEATYNASGEILSFHVRFAITETGPTARGEIFYNSTATPPPRNHITSNSEAHATKGQPFTFAITGSATETGYSASAMPPGLRLDTASGIISGTPTSEGSFLINVAATDSSTTALGNIQITVDPPYRSTGNYTALRVIGDPNDWVSLGQDRLLTRADSYVQAGSGYGYARVDIDLSSPDINNSWHLHFGAPQGQLLAPGVYKDAVRSEQLEPGHPGLDVSGVSRGCNIVTGEFEIQEIEYDVANRLKHFHATFVQHCEGGPDALYGTIWFESADALTNAPEVSVVQGAPFSFQLVANNQPTSFAADVLPTGVNLNPITGLISGATSLDPGLYLLGMTATGSGGARDNLTLKVSPAPTPTPTPLPAVATPTFKPSGGKFKKKAKVSMFCSTPGAVIHFTVDAGDPTSSSLVYNNPIVLGRGVHVVKAIGIASGYGDSAVASATFTVK
jgi:hypothetical protein